MKKFSLILIVLFSNCIAQPYEEYLDALIQKLNTQKKELLTELAKKREPKSDELTLYKNACASMLNIAQQYQELLAREIAQLSSGPEITLARNITKTTEASLQKIKELVSAS